MKIGVLISFCCVLSLSLVLGHYHNGGDEGGDWEQHGGGVWGPQGGGGRRQHGGGGWGSHGAVGWVQQAGSGWGQHGGSGWGQHGGGGRRQHGHHGHHGHHGNNGHHRGHRGNRCPFVNFEVKVPQGLEVSMIQKNPNVTMFGIEIYVNKDAVDGSVCDVCHNTTTITYGKFIIDDSEAVIKKGDILNYVVLVGDATNVTKHRPQKLYVTDSIINRCNCEETQQDPDIDLRFSAGNRPTSERPADLPSVPTPTVDPTEAPFEFDEIEKAHQDDEFSYDDTPFECDLDPVTNRCRSGAKQSPRAELNSKDWQREAQVLGDIIEQMKAGCSPKHVSNMLLLKQSSQRPSDSRELLNLVKSSLAVNAEMQDLASGINRVSPAVPSQGNAIVFWMGSYVDKQKVLYHARLNNLRQIVDYDKASKNF